MGMAASQARFLGLTARQNNLEFEGQQINQQRTMLSNESANYYNDLLGMTVPTPPSVDAFTKTVYTFSDGALTNTVTSMIAQSNGTYTMSYLSKWQDDYAPVAAATSVVTQMMNGGTPEYYVGASHLRALGSIPGKATIAPTININGNEYSVYNDGNYFIYETDKTNVVRQATQAELDAREYASYNTVTGELTPVFKDSAGFYSVDSSGNRIDHAGATEDDFINYIFDMNETDPEKATSIITKNEDGTYSIDTWDETQTKRYLTQSEINSISSYDIDPNDEYFSQMSTTEIKNTLKEEEAWKELLTQKYGESDWYIRYVLDSTTGIERPYFYSKNDLDHAQYDEKTHSSLSKINCYTIGSEQKIEEFKAIQGCKIEKDSSGRLISVSIPKLLEDGSLAYEEDVIGGTKSVVYTTYALTTETATDQEKYNDALNQYEYDKYLYDQAVENINAKIEIIQAEDKNLELRLKQLDTEQRAVQTEKEAVSKVIEKNTSDTFKTFSA